MVIKSQDQQKKQVNKLKKQITQEKREIKKAEKVINREDDEREQEIVSKVDQFALFVKIFLKFRHRQKLIGFIRSWRQKRRK